MDTGATSLLHDRSPFILPAHQLPECPPTPPLSVPTVDIDNKLAAALEKLCVTPPTEDEMEDDVCPKESVASRLAQPTEKPLQPIPSLRNSYTKREREQWVDDNLSDRIKVKLNDKNGKESLKGCFKSEAVLRHCLLPMMRRGFLSHKTGVLPLVCRDFRNLYQLLEEYADVYFWSLRGYPADWKEQTSIDENRV